MLFFRSLHFPPRATTGFDLLMALLSACTVTRPEHVVTLLEAGPELLGLTCQTILSRVLVDYVTTPIIYVHVECVHLHNVFQLNSHHMESIMLMFVEHYWSMKTCLLLVALTKEVMTFVILLFHLETQ